MKNNLDFSKMKDITKTFESPYPDHPGCTELMFHDDELLEVIHIPGESKLIFKIQTVIFIEHPHPDPQTVKQAKDGKVYTSKDDKIVYLVLKLKFEDFNCTLRPVYSEDISDVEVEKKEEGFDFSLACTCTFFNGKIESYQILEDVEPKIEIHFISKCCGGEKCSVCGKDATHKIGEEILIDDPMPNRHNLTAYICCEHFKQLFGECR